MKKSKHERNREEARELYHNKGLGIKELAVHYARSERTIYRWLNSSPSKCSSVPHPQRKELSKARNYPLEIQERIIALKKEIPQRSAPMIKRLLKKEFDSKIPSLSTIRRYIMEAGLSFQNREQNKGYVRFERDHPNDLWQIDIAGVQTVGHLKQLYLIALLDDYSRFIVAAQYFKDQQGKNVLKIIRNAVVQYGRPNQILADNGSQFRNVMGELGTKYSRFLDHLDIDPIFAKPHHPQTKGKLERWFGTVNHMFLVEARQKVTLNPKMSLSEYNSMFQEWVQWYNTEKSHRNLPNNCPPCERYFQDEARIFRPLKAMINWNRWLHELERRKVTKYNEIHYKSQKFHVPPGYSGTKVEVIEYEDRIEIYFKEQLLIAHPYNVTLKKERKIRKISHNGTIKYLGTSYSIDYKLAGKTVEVQEMNEGKNLLVYLNDVLLTTLDK